MPTPAETFSQIGQQPQQQQGSPFGAFLQPRPIDALPQPGTQATGFEKPAVGLGEVALGFLQGIRKTRVAQTAEQEANNETSLTNYRQQVTSMLQDPKLTPDAKKAIEAQANSVLHQHMQFELRDAPKDGVGGFFKNLLIQASGGPIKTREPIDFDNEVGKLTRLAGGEDPNTPGVSYNVDKNYNKAVTGVSSEIQALGPNPSPWNIKPIVEKWNTFVQQHAPGQEQNFIQAISMHLPPTFEEILNQRMLQRIGPPTSAPPPAPGAATQPGTTAAPAPPGQSSMGMATVNPPNAWTAAPPPTPAQMGGAFVGQPALSTPLPAAPNVHSVDTRVPAVSAPPSAGGLPDLDFRNPVDKAIMQKMGYDLSGVDKPETLYDPTDTTYSNPITNMVRDPVTQRLVDRSTGEPAPPGTEHYVPSSQVRRPISDPLAVENWATSPGGFAQPYRYDKRTNTMVPIAGVGGKPLYSANIPMVAQPNASSPTGEAYGPRGPGSPVMPALPTAAQQRTDAGETAAGQLMDRAGNDPLLAQDLLAADKTIPADVKTMARRSLEAAYQRSDILIRAPWQSAQRKRQRGSQVPPAMVTTPATGAATPSTGAAGATPPPSAQYRRQ